MVFPRLFTCPTLETTNFKVGKCCFPALVATRGPGTGVAPRKGHPEPGTDTPVCLGQVGSEHLTFSHCLKAHREAPCWGRGSAASSPGSEDTCVVTQGGASSLVSVGRGRETGQGTTTAGTGQLWAQGGQDGDAKRVAVL